MRRHALQAQSAPKPGTLPDTLSLIRAYDSDYNPSRPVRSSPLNASTMPGLPLELVDRLRSFPLFASAPDTFLGAIGKYLRPQLHQPHEYILTEGHDARSMYWLVRGSVRVTSRDGESTYAELKPGAFFGEIGILMDIPRTATVIAKLRSLVVKLNKEDLQKELPSYPDVERVIREEAAERLAILERMKKSHAHSSAAVNHGGLRKRSRDFISGDVEMGEAGDLSNGEVTSNKRRKSPSPSLAEAAASSVLGNASLTVRQILKELPLFSELPDEILHFLGVNAQPCIFPPFTEILTQGSQGRDVFFLVKGEVEVVTENTGGKPGHAPEFPKQIQRVRARLKTGQYFGEVTSLSLAPKRTATVRTINGVECLRITGEVLDELWRNWSADLRQQVEQEAKRRLKEAEDVDIVLQDVFDGPSAMEILPPLPHDEDWRRSVPTVTFSSDATADTPAPQDLSPVSAEPLDPDPFYSAELDNMRARSRRGSLVPPTQDISPASVLDPTFRQPSPPTLRHQPSSPLKPRSSASSIPPSPENRPLSRRPSVLGRQSSLSGRGSLPDSVLVRVFQHLDFLQLMRLRSVSGHWHRVLSTSPHLLDELDLSHYNRWVTDVALKEFICPFVGARPRHVNLNNCFHVTDDGFNALASTCGKSVRIWKMRSVWDVTGQSILDLVNNAKKLEDIDLSNCRKVGDNLLARIVGWVVPHPAPGQVAPLLPPVSSAPKRTAYKRGASSQQVVPQADQAPPGTVIGAPSLKRLTLSYCKHVQDRSMAHIAAHAANRLEVIDLTRCTSVTDQGFQHWSIYNFPKLTKLILADCTYLTDQAIVGIANAARGLKELDLSFCCALSDTATEVLSLGLTQLTHLDLAFCGSAVSDSSLRCIGLHLLELKYLSVRGCVRVTGQGVESVIDGCRNLEILDVTAAHQSHLRRRAPSIFAPPNLKPSTAFVAVAAAAAAAILMSFSMSSLLQRLTRPFSSTTMRFGPEGSAGQTQAFPEGAQRATVAAGCFWGVEHMYRHNFPKDAVLDARVGYIGGNTQNPGYRAVCTGNTGHAEALQLVFNPDKVSYRTLLEFFYKMHDPTTRNRQGPDTGSQYRSGIFTHDDEQDKIAREVTKQVQEQWWKDGKVVTEILPAGEWWDAETYHQLYLDKNPGGYECPSHFLRKFPALQ
ncbi:hypothetical protein MBLNU459_g0833t1 [Dothideomycetes sp. NU459]